MTTKARVRPCPLTEPLPGLATLGWSALDRLATPTGAGSHVDNGGISILTQGETIRAPSMTGFPLLSSVNIWQLVCGSAGREGRHAALLQNGCGLNLGDWPIRA